MYSIDYSSRYKKSYKLAQKRGLDVGLLNDIVRRLALGEKLAAKHRDHALTGNYAGCRECHITPDWLLVYKIEGSKCLLYLVDTGTHADLF